jgi:uncharacterized cupin superfamily protein
MSDSNAPTKLAVRADAVPPRTKHSNYPEPFFSRMTGPVKQQLGNFFGVTNFGVNLTTLAPGAESALLHRHTKQDEFVYILAGRPTLITETEEIELSPGMCAGFPAQGVAHQLVNRTDAEIVYLEIGDRRPGDEASYPNDDLQAAFNADGSWQFTHKDGRPY